MKTVYIATAIDSETGDAYQENAYTDAARALERAKVMVADIQKNMANFNLQASITTIDVYEDEDPVVDMVDYEEQAGTINGEQS